MTTPSTSARPTHNEDIKAAIPTLAGSIVASIADAGMDHFSQDDYEFLKFHGCYQQDDRDLRKTAKHYMMMVRSRIPGGVMTANQWIIFDGLSAQYGNNTLRVTTRQTIQFHGILKNNLRAVIKGINESLLSTLAACGDVSRNVLAPPTPAHTAAREQVFADCRKVAMTLAPKTPAYHAIWIDGVQLNLEDEANKNFVDPLYGKTYLPRKFKVAFAIPPTNDVDVFANDVGFIAVVENDKLTGYNIAVGGGMGRSHGNDATYPRLADVLGFLTPEKVTDAAKAVLTIHRDFGDRTNRKHARLKYVVEERGADWVRAELENRAGFRFEPARPCQIHQHRRSLRLEQGGGRNMVPDDFCRNRPRQGCRRPPVENRLAPGCGKISSLEFRLTTNQNVILANVTESDKVAVNDLLAQHGVKTENQASVLHAASMACPALPTCGLALAESERMLPGLIDRIEKLCAEAGLAGQEIIIRSTGCPNGCARPYLAEIGFVGKSPGRYQIWLGSDAAGTRLNRLWKDMVKDPDIENELRPVLARFARERNSGERFGDWCDRVFLKEQAVSN